MTLKAKITKAISAHFMWKVHLKKAIDIGESEYKVEIVKKDNVCDFGKWLLEIKPIYKDDKQYKSISSLHTEFHLAAAEVLDLALKGEKIVAEKKMDSPNSEYRTISRKLTLEMASWRDSL